MRLLVGDDRRQAAQAQTLARESAETNEPLFVPLTVMLELEWVLRSRYRFSKDSVLSALVNLLETREIEFQDEITRLICFHRFCWWPRHLDRACRSSKLCTPAKSR